jgi:hypothetical protein
MAVYETFSKRLEKQQKAGQPDVLQYEHLPDAFRVQVIHILGDAIGQWRYESDLGEEPVPNQWWQLIQSQMAREFGVFRLSTKGTGPQEECRFLIQEATIGHVLDLIEFAFLVIDDDVRSFVDRYGHPESPANQSPDDAIAELNQRFLEHGIGYAFIDGQLVRKDSEILHAEVVKPALALLSGANFSGPSEEFLSAYEHYRHGRHKEAIQDALKAFESTMKAICDARGWAYDPGATAKPLIELLLANELLPQFLQAHFNALSSVMGAGLPTVRNKLSGHGQGATPVDVPPYFVAYALHLAASNIVMLVEAHNVRT